MKKRNNYLLCQNNKGSAIINVIIAMLFIIALGSALLYTTYIGYSVSVSDRTEKGNFYNAESQMNRILTGLHTSLSDSIAVAYTKTITEYAKGKESNPQTEFNDNLITQLGNSTVTVNGGAVPLFTKVNDNLFYSVYGLAGFLDGESYYFNGVTATVTKGGVTIELSGDNDGNFIVTKTLDAKGIGYLTLKDINMSFESNGYQTTIKTDIKINIPEFLIASATSAEVGNYAIIAEQGISHSINGDFTIEGNVFTSGSGISIAGSDNSFTFLNGNVVAKGGITVKNDAMLSFSGSDNELWTDEITLGTSGAIDLKGKVYVADDLIFAGQNSSATLEGEYYGFGSGNIPNESSAILVNAKESTLTMSKLNRLSLAGVSFIELNNEGLTNGGVGYTTPIIMGESISTKADQLAYLLPPECMDNYYTNPCILDDSSEISGVKIAPKVVENTVLWTINGVDKTLKYYLGEGLNKKGEVISLYSTSGNIQFAYVFIVFSDLSAANEYFKDYFTTYPERIEQYTDLYLSINGKAGKVSAAGNTFYSADGDKLSLYPADTAVLTGNMSTRYKNKISPLDKFVYRDKLNELSGTLIFKEDGKDVAVVINEESINFTYDTTYFDTDYSVKLIVAKGDVTINDNFTGIIIAGGTVTVNKGIVAEPIDPNILDAVVTDSNGKVLYTLSNFVRGSAGTSTENVWDLSNLVVYDNWKKN